MKDVLIFGAGQIAEVFAEYLRDNKHRIKAFVVDADYMTDAVLRDVPVVALEDVAKLYSPEAHSFVVGMSFKGLNAMRAKKYEEMKAKGYEPLTFVDKHARVAASARIGPGSFILDGNVIQTGVVIGENVVCWSGNHIGHHSKIASHVWVCSHAVISGDCSIGERTFVGVNASTRDGIKIGKECLIGADSYIAKDCVDFGVYAAPATERHAVPSYKLRGF